MKKEQNTDKPQKKVWSIANVVHRYFFISWHKHWKGIYIHLPKVTHRVYLDRNWKLHHDKHSNIGARISQKLDV
jgi:hypothetical protein